MTLRAFPEMTPDVEDPTRCHHRRVTTVDGAPPDTLVAAPGLAVPDCDGRARPIIFGTASWIGGRLGVSVVVVRACFVVAASAGGLGLVAYLVLSVLVRARRPPDVVNPVETSREVGLGLLTLGLIGAFSGWPGVHPAVVGPAALAALGICVSWRSGDMRRAAGHAIGGVPAGTGGAPDASAVRRVLAGLLAVFAAVFLLAGQRVGLNELRDGVFAVLLALGGVAVVGWPWLRAAVAANRTAREATIRAQVHAEIADHLHDSVLQTLTLIQRHQGDSRTVGRLARAQERDLRRWLYGGRVDPDDRTVTTWRAAMEDLVDEIDETFGVVVESVVVGDAPMDVAVEPLMGATREALRNAARHSGCQQVSLFSEASPDDITVFVRDRGCGFDASTVAGDRRGISSSIVGRLERAGGGAAVTSVPGDGTEVEMRLPRSARENVVPVGR